MGHNKEYESLVFLSAVMRHQILRTAIYISYLNRNLPRLIKVFPEAFDDATLVIKHDKACQLRGRYLLKKRDRRY